MKNVHSRFSDKLVDLSALKSENKSFDYACVSVSREEGESLSSLIAEKAYRETIEIGCALGVSSLYICDALAKFDNVSHTIIDPYQMSNWKGIGVENLKRRGVDFFELIEEPSELALPRLLESEKKYDLAFIDGWHTFDHSLVDFFYLNRLIKPGGVIVFDDANWPSVNKLVNYVLNYPCYKLISPSSVPKAKGALYQDGFLGRVVKSIGHCSTLFPPRVRNRVFPKFITQKNAKVETQRWVVVEKQFDDSRSFDWYMPF